MNKDTTPIPAAGVRYRGACVEDLQLPPAFCLPQDAPISQALEAAYERDFDHLPILNGHRKPVGYLDIPALKKRVESGEAVKDGPVSARMTHFSISGNVPSYTVITPLTTLEDLEHFFDARGSGFALVTDSDRKWVLAVATKDDLETFVKRRG